MPMPRHRLSYRPAGSVSETPRYDVPVLGSIGAWTLLLSWDIAGPAGLLLPGAAGWIMVLVALLRFVTRPGAARPRASRAMGRLWLGCAVAFLLLAGIELFLGHGMPQSWKDSLVQALHIRRVDRSYGSSP